MQGILSEGVLPGLLRELYVGRRTGFLRFSRGEEEARVLFIQGQMVRASTNVGEDRLGETLVKHGLLSEEDLLRATAVVLRDHTRLGTALVDLGILDHAHLEEGLAVHLRENLLKIFSWHESTYEFEEVSKPASEDGDTTSLLSTGEMILEVVKRISDPDVIRYALGDIDRIVGLTTDPLLRFQKIQLTPADGYVVSRIDGTTSVRELVQMIPLVAEDAMRSLFGLVSTGVVEFLPLPPKAPPKSSPLVAPAAVPVSTAPAPGPPVSSESQAPADTERSEIVELFEGLKTKNHFEVLGIPKASSEAQVKEAYFRLAKRFHPDAHRDPALSALKEQMQAIFIRLGEAYEVLKNPKSRSAYETDLASRAPRGPSTAPAPTPAPMDDAALLLRRAEDVYRKADKLIQEEKFWDAIQLLEPAIPTGKERIKQRLCVLLAKCYLRNPKWLHRAEELLRTSNQEDPKYIEPYLMLGSIYKSGNLRSRALSMFRKVIELQPDHEAALKELEELQPPAPAEAQPEEKSGIFRKIFGKP